MAFYGPGNSLWMDSNGIVLSGFDSDGYSTSNSATWQSTMIKVENPYPSETRYFSQTLAMGYGKILVQGLYDVGTIPSHVYSYDYDGNFIDSIPLPSDQGYSPNNRPAFQSSSWGTLMATGNGRFAIAGNGYRQDLGGRSDNYKRTVNIALYDMDLNYIKTLFPTQWNNTYDARPDLPTVTASGQNHELNISNGKVILLSKDFKDSQGVPLGDSQNGRVVIFDLFDWDSGEETYIYPRIQKDTSNQGLETLAVAHNRIFVGVDRGYDSTSPGNDLGMVGVYDLHSGSLIRRIQNPLGPSEFYGDNFGGNLGAGAGRLCVGGPKSDGEISIFDLNGELIKEKFNPAEGWSDNLYSPSSNTSIIENEKIYVPVENRAGAKHEQRIYIMNLDGSVLGFVHEDDSDVGYQYQAFGDNLTADGNILVVGNANDSSSTTGEKTRGSMYIFTIGDEKYSNYVDNVIDLKR